MSPEEREDLYAELTGKALVDWLCDADLAARSLDLRRNFDVTLYSDGMQRVWPRNRPQAVAS